METRSYSMVQLTNSGITLWKQEEILSKLSSISPFSHSGIWRNSFSIVLQLRQIESWAEELTGQKSSFPSSTSWHISGQVAMYRIKDPMTSGNSLLCWRHKLGYEGFQHEVHGHDFSPSPKSMPGTRINGGCGVSNRSLSPLPLQDITRNSWSGWTMWAARWYHASCKERQKL